MNLNTTYYWVGCEPVHVAVVLTESSIAVLSLNNHFQNDFAFILRALKIIANCLFTPSDAEIQIRLIYSAFSVTQNTTMHKPLYSVHKPQSLLVQNTVTILKFYRILAFCFIRNLAQGLVLKFPYF